MKISFNRIKLFAATANGYLKAYPDETKVKLAIQEIGPDVNKVLEKIFPKKREKIDIKFANVDANGSILYTVSEKGVRTYMFTPDKLIERDEAIEKLMDEELFDIEPFYITDLPPNFDESFRPYFEGFIIDKNEQPAREA